MPTSYEQWLTKVRVALDSINMPLEEWQAIWPFPLEREYNAGTLPADAAEKANRFWWRQQNISLDQDCRISPGCWLPRDHNGPCQPVKAVYEAGDFVKVDFPDESTGIAEWMWMRVSHCDEEKQIVYGVLDNEPLNDYGRPIGPGSPLAVSYSRIREHRKPGDFRKH